MKRERSGSIFRLFLEAERSARGVEHRYEEHTTSLAVRMIGAREENGFILAMVVGPLGVGKSVYAIISAWQYLRHFGLVSRRKEKGTMEVVKKYLTFFASDRDKTTTLEYMRTHGIINDTVARLDTLESMLRTASFWKRRDVVVWDDAGVFGSAYRFFTNKKFVMKMAALLQLARRRTYALIITTPALEYVLAAARNIPETLVVLIERYDKQRSLAKGYKLHYLPSGKRYIKKVFEDRFNRYLPDKVFEVYAEMTDAYVDAALSLEDLDKPVEVKLEGETIMLDDDEVRALRILINSDGYMTRKELGALMNISPNVVGYSVMPRLVARGYVESGPRGYRITDKGVKLLKQIIKTQLKNKK